jgi:hypothetical protein
VPSQRARWRCSSRRHCRRIAACITGASFRTAPLRLGPGLGRQTEEQSSRIDRSSVMAPLASADLSQAGDQYDEMRPGRPVQLIAARGSQARRGDRADHRDPGAVTAVELLPTLLAGGKGTVVEPSPGLFQRLTNHTNCGGFCLGNFRPNVVGLPSLRGGGPADRATAPTRPHRTGLNRTTIPRCLCDRAIDE